MSPHLAPGLCHVRDTPVPEIFRARCALETGCYTRRMDAGSYWLGLLTFPALGVLGLAGIWAHWLLGKSDDSGRGCEHCTAAGYAWREWNSGDRTRLGVWFTRWLHRNVASRRKAHRVSWQRVYDEWGMNLRGFYARAQRKYGVN